MKKKNGSCGEVKTGGNGRDWEGLSNVSGLGLGLNQYWWKAGPRGLFPVRREGRSLLLRDPLRY